MTETTYFWSGTSVGDASLAPYSDDAFSDLFSIAMTYDRATQGVIVTNHSSYNSMLVVSNAGGSTARTSNGAALVDGKLYLNTANVDVTVSGNAVYWVIGLRKSWAGQTVRIFGRGNYATRALALASLVQTDATTWEIPLATVLTTAGGAVSTVTDERSFLVGGSSGQIVKIFENVIPAGGAVIDWNNIPQNYAHLLCRYTGQFYEQPISPVSGIQILCNLNGDTTPANYFTGYYYITPSADTTGYGDISGTLGYMYCGNTGRPDTSTPYADSGEFIISNYRRTDFYKLLHYRWSGITNPSASDTIEEGFGTWLSTVAVTRIQLYSRASVYGASPNFAPGSVFTLYGIT